MACSDQEKKHRTAPIFNGQPKPLLQNSIPSSSPDFGTPIHPIQTTATIKPSILPIIVPPATLRPIAFRTFTKKHSLTLNSSALQTLATFIGKQCGTEWRESGLAEPVLEDIAKSWKNRNGNVIVDGEAKELKEILKNLEGFMIGGKIASSRELSRQNSFVVESPQHSDKASNSRHEIPSAIGNRDKNFHNHGFPELAVSEEDDLNNYQDPRSWLKIIDAFELPRLVYNVGKKHFDRVTIKPTLFPSASQKTQLFRNRYNLIYQRLMRNEAFQKPTFDISTSSLRRSYSGLDSHPQFYKLTPISNLLGRNGTNHLILGLLTISPTDALSINDLTGSITLDLTHAKPIPEDGAWFTPGMIVLVDGTYIEEDNSNGTALGGSGGIGGFIGGKFVGFFVGGPPCERRKVSLGLHPSGKEDEISTGGEFGWVDFLGVGSERALGSKMRKIEQKVLKPSSIFGKSSGRGRIVILGEVNLDQPTTLRAIKRLLGLYAGESQEDNPMAFVLMGNFVQHAVMARASCSESIEYKEGFDGLASILSEYPTLLQNATFIFVPGDNDGWASAFGAGAATMLPRRGVPEIFTSRIRRAFAAANADAEKEHGRKANGEAIWTTNPARISMFGPTHEIVLMRDDMTSRFCRNAIHFPHSKAVSAESENENTDMQQASFNSEATNPKPCDITQSTRKLVKPLLDQGYLSPFPLSQRPVHWDYATALQIYPLPTALVLADADALAFTITYEGCCVMNPGRLVVAGRNNMARWVEYDVRKRNSVIRETQF